MWFHSRRKSFCHVTLYHQKTSLLRGFELNPDSNCDLFTQAEVSDAVKQMKLGNAPGLDGLPLEVWKLPKVQESLLKFCNDTFAENRPKEMGISGITPIPKKGDLRYTDNYRGIRLTQVAAKIYNRLLLNRIRPAIDKLLPTNQHGFRSPRSTSSQILALRRIIEELQNHAKERVIVFFEPINREKMFVILEVYGIPPAIVNARA